MSMRDYVQKTRHLASCIVTKPIDMASQVHVFVFGMREGMTRYCLTRAEPATLEEAFALALSDDYVVASSYGRQMPAEVPSSGPAPMEIDAVEASQRQQWSSSGRGRGGREPRALICLRCRKPGHRAAVCRAPALVIAHMEHAASDEKTPAGTSRGGAPYWLEWSGDSRLIIVSLFVAGARRTLRALLDSGAANNFFRASCLSILPAGVPVRDLSGDVVVKLADGKPRRVARRELSLPYTFDGFHSNDNFIVFDMNYAFDCILGIPWLVRYQPQIDWLARSVKRRQDFDVTEVLTHLLVAPRDWPHVTVVDGASTTHVVHRASDGPLCPTCAVLLTGDEDEEPARGRASERRAVEHPWLPRMKNETVELRLPYVKEAVEQWFSPSNEAVEQWFPPANEAVEQGLPHDDVAGEQELRPRVKGAAENELSRLEEGEASSSESDTSISSRGSRRTKTLRRSKRRLKPRRAVDLPSTPTDSVCTVEYVDGAPNRTRVIEVGSPPRDAKSITSVPGLSWKNFLRDLDEVIAGIGDESTYSSFGSAVEEGHDQTLEDTWIGARSLLLQPQQQNWADVLRWSYRTTSEPNVGTEVDSTMLTDP
ncbi:hypothetical protein PR001_g3559 [Phytophthora rubi]|uniref:CCHC-type domain-containing protein n=1 Tax=Phytophthora rubi TaxID=129364 RepID=A0A6A3P9D8_9STRA|nr:hypothetical protein PR001_g3559 [Phytophthora rubi]